MLSRASLCHCHLVEDDMNPSLRRWLDGLDPELKRGLLRHPEPGEDPAAALRLLRAALGCENPASQCKNDDGAMTLLAEKAGIPVFNRQPKPRPKRDKKGAPWVSRKILEKLGCTADSSAALCMAYETFWCAVMQTSTERDPLKRARHVINRYIFPLALIPLTPSQRNQLRKEFTPRIIDLYRHSKRHRQKYVREKAITTEDMIELQTAVGTIIQERSSKGK